MQGRLTRTDVEAAREDLKNRTLVHIGTEFGRLIYLASTRDYNNGRYYHEGLAFQFSEAVAGEALSQAHREVFMALSLCPLEDLVEALQLYLQSLGTEPMDFIRVWEKTEPYRVVIPIDSDSLTANLFLANVKIALAIVDSHQQAVL